MKWLRRWVVGLGIVAAWAAVGCDSGETTTAGAAGTGGTTGTGSTGGAGGSLDCPEDPAAGEVADGCGIWVSVEKGLDTNEGTQAAPVATLMRAIELAAGGPGRVYACGETWNETLIVPSGVSLHGGFDCTDGWTYSGATKKAMVAAPSAPSPIAATWVGGGSMKQAFLTDFSIKSPDATGPGGSSIACFIRDELPLIMRRSECIAGNGADGADGAPGDPNGLPAMAGAPGNDGAAACGAPLSKGGEAPETACESGVSRGGKGGDSSTALAANGADGEPASSPPSGAGGLGEQAAPTCTAGGAGESGETGDDGLGGGKAPDVGYGRLTEQGYITVTAGDGAPGAFGKGGGGGGATFGSAAACGGASSGGAAGGSGGSGGCGGKGGKAGQSGGASIGLAVRSNSVSFEEGIVIRAGNGGKGGNGGAPQPGGSGGDSGMGGAGFGSIKPGCAGGKGGNGGAGGYGGGGAGGHTFAIAFLKDGSFPLLQRDTLYSQGKEGEGGQGNPLQVDSWGYPGVNLIYAPMKH